MSGSLTRIAREVTKHKFNLVGLQGVRWEKEDTVRVGAYIFYMERETKIIKG
jgi:hypothetical protein